MNVPDSIYSMCGDNCDICSNTVFSNITKSVVHDTQRGKVFCPFGTGESMNQTIYSDQEYLNSQNNYPATAWGRCPQVSPRPLSKIGLSWRTS